jgi:hypothetical protein
MTAMREEVEALKAEALAAIDDARREQLAEIARLRAITIAHLAERDPTTPLQ